jgi:hypothetical protein
MIVSNFLQVISSLYYIFFPHFNKSTPFITATAVMLTWFSLGYFLEFDNRFSLFYLILRRSSKTHLKYLIIFFFFFLGIAYLGQIMFSSSQNFSSISKSTRSLFSLIFADTVYDIMTDAYEISPFASIIFFISFIFLSYVFAQRLLVSVTEDAFDSIKFKSSYYWLEKKISVEDYLKIETDEKDDMNHYMLSDIMMNIILSSKEEKINKMEDILMLDEGKVKADGYDVDKVREVFRKHFKRIHKEAISNEIMKDIINHDYINDPHGISLRLGLTETLRFQNLYEYSDTLMRTIEKNIDKMIDISKFNEGNSNMKGPVLIFIEKTLIIIRRIKNRLNRVNI